MFLTQIRAEYAMHVSTCLHLLISANAQFAAQLPFHGEHPLQKRGFYGYKKCVKSPWVTCTKVCKFDVCKTCKLYTFWCIVTTVKVQDDTVPQSAEVTSQHLWMSLSSRTNYVYASRGAPPFGQRVHLMNKISTPSSPAHAMWKTSEVNWKYQQIKI